MHIDTVIPVAWVYVLRPCFAYSQIDLVLFVHLSMWYRSHCLSHRSHTQESVGSWNVSSLHRRWWKPCTPSRVITWRSSQFADVHSLSTIAPVPKNSGHTSSLRLRRLCSSSSDALVYGSTNVVFRSSISQQLL